MPLECTYGVNFTWVGVTSKNTHQVRSRVLFAYALNFGSIFTNGHTKIELRYAVLTLASHDRMFGKSYV